MFFTPKHFGFLNEDSAKAASDKANEVIKAQSVPIFGNHFENKSLDNFSSEQKPKDTHNAIAIGLGPMGMFDDDRDIMTESPDVQDLNRAQEQKIAALEAELRQSRKQGANNE